MTNWKLALVAAAVITLAVFALISTQPDPADIHPPTDTGAETSDAQASAEERTTQTTQPQGPQERTIQMRVHRQAYNPDRIEVNKGDTITITATATDGIAHGFAIGPYEISQRIEPGEYTTFSFEATQAGEYTYYSNVASHAGAGNLKGTLVVNE